jgi:hypothetical protein
LLLGDGGGACVDVGTFKALGGLALRHWGSPLLRIPTELSIHSEDRETIRWVCFFDSGGMRRKVRK